MENSNLSKNPTKYWLVELTLTSGEVLEFYVKAKTQFDAYEKAEEYMFWLDNKKLKNKLKEFRLMP
jgi:hypothetical protein